MHLPQGAGASHEGAGCKQFLELAFGQGFAALPMAGHAEQGGPVIAPVLHELAGQLHRIPLHVVDAGSLGALHRGEHVLQAMAELVEQGFHLAEGHQAGGLTHRRTLVADQIGHGQDRRAIGSAGTDQAFVHPGTATLAARPAVGIEVESGQGLATVAVVDPEEAHIGMPARRLTIGGLDANAEQAPAELEETLENLGQREPGPQGFAVEVESLAAQVIGPEAHIPGLEIGGFGSPVALGAGPQIGQLLHGHRVGGSAQILE